MGLIAPDGFGQSRKFFVPHMSLALNEYYPLIANIFNVTNSSRTD